MDKLMMTVIISHWVWRGFMSMSQERQSCRTLKVLEAMSLKFTASFSPSVQGDGK